MTASQWGPAVHVRMRDDFETLKKQYPLIYTDTFAELSLTPLAKNAPYRSKDSSRLDMVEVRDDVVCIYDVKTGKRGIEADQLRRMMTIAVSYGKFTFYIIEVRPSP